MTAPRVLMTTDAVGGVWTYSVDLAEALAYNGVETTLAVFGPAADPVQTAAAADTPGLIIVETGLPLDWTAETPKQISNAGAGLRELARSSRADLIHLNSPALAAIGGFFVPIVGVLHSCLASWWRAVKRGPLPIEFEWRAQALRQGMMECDRLVAPSAAFADLTARANAAPRPLVIRNGRKQMRLDKVPRERIAFTCGRLWDEGKDIATLDAAAVELNSELRVAGPLGGPNGERAKIEHASYLGRLSERQVAAQMRRAAVFASAALYEPFGLGVLEAAQAGCALVLSDIPTFRELWNDAAVFVSPRDSAGFADSMNDLLANPLKAARLGELARARAAEYSLQAMSDGVLEIYRGLNPARFQLPLNEAAE